MKNNTSPRTLKIAGFPLPLYLGIAALVAVCMYADCLPGGLVGGLIVLMVLGEGLNAIGNSTPVVKTYLGGSVICILGAAAIQAAGLIPEQTHMVIDNFVNREGFLVFYISALITNDGHETEPRPPMKPSFALLCTGLIISLAFYELGALFHHFITVIPTYAWMIIAVVLVKGSGIMSEELEDAAREWGQFAIHSWTAAALTGIGATLIDLKTILQTMTPFYLLSVMLVVASITLTAAFVGKKAGFYPLESAIAAGMCTTNMGGSGNVAVLSSAQRMELLPFAQIVTRSCGALMLTLGGILVQLLK